MPLRSRGAPGRVRAVARLVDCQQRGVSRPLCFNRILEDNTPFLDTWGRKKVVFFRERSLQFHDQLLFNYEPFTLLVTTGPYGGERKQCSDLALQKQLVVPENGKRNTKNGEMGNGKQKTDKGKRSLARPGELTRFPQLLKTRIAVHGGEVRLVGGGHPGLRVLSRFTATSLLRRCFSTIAVMDDMHRVKRRVGFARDATMQVSSQQRVGDVRAPKRNSEKKLRHETKKAC